jgi:hypothetical protein
MSGSEKVRIVGDTRIEGKLTVTGLIDPTGLYLDEQVGDQPAVANKGVFYTKDVLGNTEAFYRASNGVVTQVTGGGGGGVTLDGAYDFGGAGAGRIVTSDAGAVRINKTSVDANNGFEVVVSGGTGLAALFSGGRVSCPGAGTTSERFGAGASISGTGDFALVIGGAAVSAAGDSDCISIGHSATAGTTGATDCVAIGHSVNAGTFFTFQEACIAIGVDGTGAGYHSIALGIGAVAGTLHVNNAECIAIGDGASANRAGTATDLIAIGDAAFAQGLNDCVAIGDGPIAGTTATDAYCIAIGTNTRAWNGIEHVALGHGAKAQGANNTIAVGQGAQSGNAIATGNNLIAIGQGASALGLNDCIAIGQGANAGSAGTSVDCIGIGNSCSGIGANDVIVIGRDSFNRTASNTRVGNVFVAGGVAHAITDVYFGTGIGSTGTTAPSSFTIHGTGGSATVNQNGASIKIAGGTGFGAGNQGNSVIIQTARDGTATTLVDTLTADRNGNVVVGNAALTTTATDGFLYIETCAGTPTGVPTSYTGRVPTVYDTSTDKLWIYNGSWKSATFAP